MPRVHPLRPLQFNPVSRPVRGQLGARKLKGAGPQTKAIRGNAQDGKPVTRASRAKYTPGWKFFAGLPASNPRGVARK